MKCSKIVVFFLAFSLLVIPRNVTAQTYDKCYTAHKTEKYSESEVCWRKLIKINPSNPRAYYYLGQALRKQAEELGDQDDKEKLEEAVDAYKKAIQLSQNNYAWAWNGLANALDLQKKSDEAIKAYRQSLNVPNQPGPPTNAHTVSHCNLGNKLEQQGRRLERTDRQSNKEIAEQKFAEAIDEAQKGIKFDSKHDSCWVLWGDVLSAQKKYEAAIEKYRQASILEPENAYLYVMWGRALGGLGQLDQAIEKYRQATQVKNKEALSFRAWAYVEWGDTLWFQAKYRDTGYQQGKITDAIDKYQKALESPNNDEVPTMHAFAHNGLGLVYWQYLGNLEMAKAEFGKAIEPDSPLNFAKNNYKEVERLLQLQSGKQFLPVSATQYLPRNEQTATKRSVVKVVTRFWVQGVDYGTGWVMHRQGDRAWIVTNRHVVFNGSQDGDEIQIEPYYGDVPNNLIPSRLNARIVNKTLANESLDLAVLEVEFSDVPPDVKSLSTNAENTRNNTSISVIGNIDFIWHNGVLKEVSPKEITLEPLLKAGNSGSPVLNAQNQVMGLIYTSDPDQKIGKYSYAHPINLVNDQITQWRIPRP
jgi:tetratricopeptide (TPR) repeat protein